MRPLAALAAAALMSTATASVPLADSAPPETFAPRATSPQGLPAGWRWESFGGVEVGVPADWAWADSNLRLTTWCLSPTREPAVARPGQGVLAVGCLGPPDADTLIKNTGWVVGFDFGPAPAPDGVERRGDRTTVRLDGVEVAIQVPRGLRERIAATVHRVTVDHAGCPVTDPVSIQPLRRPSPAAAVTTLRDVTSVSVCKYQLASFAAERPIRLTASLHLDAAAATAAVQEITRAPAGGGPDDPRLCRADVDHGDEAIVLRVQSAAGHTQIRLRYAGCTDSGFDDGVTTRRLTAAAVAPFIAGPNQVFSLNGPDAKVPMLMPSPR
jgi:hypothetical protein